MKNILHYLKSVNIENLTNQEKTDCEFALAQQLLYIDTDNNEVFEKRTVGNLYWYYGLKVDNCDHKQNKCGRDTDLIFAIAPEAKSQQKRNVISPDEKFPIINFLSTRGIEPINFIKTICRQYLDTFRYISIEKGGEVYFIQQFQKGAERYQTKAKWEIIDFCKTADKKYKNCVFLTLTMAQEAYNGNFAYAWKPFSKELSKFTEKLRKFMDCDFVWVKESTLKGFPHAHLLIYHNEEFHHEFRNKGKKKKKKYISAGEWYDFLHRAWTFGFFDSDINRRKNTYNYLVKYIVKSAKAQFKNILKASKVTKEDAKDLLTVVMPIYSKTRGYQMSQMEIAEEVKAERIESNVFLTEEERKKAEEKELEFLRSSTAREESRTYLKSLSNNSEICNTKKIGFYTETTLSEETNGFPEKINDLTVERRKLIHEKYAKKICMGCIKSQLVLFYLGKDDSLFKESVNLDLLVGIIDWANRQIENFEAIFQESWSDEQKLFFYIDAFIKELNLNGTVEQITKWLHALFYMNPLIWFLYMPKEVASQFYLLRLQKRYDVIERYKNSPLYGSLIDKFEKFFLTYSANGSTID